MLYRDFLRAGDFVEMLPVGLPVTLKYNAMGKFESAHRTHDMGDMDSDLYSHLVTTNAVPTKIATNNGTAYIKGVLELSNDYVKELGELPQVIEVSEQLKEDLKGSMSTRFVAYDIDSTSLSFGGPNLFRTWFKNQGFDPVIGFLATYGDIDAQFSSVLASNGYTERDIYGLLVFRGKDFFEMRMRNKVDRITKIETYLDRSGCVFAHVKTKLGGDLRIPYFDVVEKNLYSKDYVLMSESGQIISKYDIYSSNNSSNPWFECPVCGKRYLISERFSFCTDPHCLSTQYDRAVHFANVLGIEPFSYDAYVETVMSGKLERFRDILLLPEYADAEISASLYDLMNAIVPIYAVPRRESLWKLYSMCNGSFDSIMYYMSHPGTILSDLGIQDQNLVNWVSDEENREDFSSIVNFSNVTISDSSKRFDGSPIFRGKSIAITGRFKHGTHEEISAILRSYSAEVRPFDESDCIIVGDIQEDVNGSEVAYMRVHNLPVFTESEFFEMYDIDADLRNIQGMASA